MKEDIELLEKLKWKLSKLPEHTTAENNNAEIQAIENLIKAYKELEEQIRKKDKRIERQYKLLKNSISKDQIRTTIEIFEFTPELCIERLKVLLLEE